MAKHTLKILRSTFYMKRLIWDALGDLEPFAQFKKRENTHGGVLLLVKLQAPFVFFTFFKLCKCTKSRKASHVYRKWFHRFFNMLRLVVFMGIRFAVRIFFICYQNWRFVLWIYLRETPKFICFSETLLLNRRNILLEGNYFSDRHTKIRQLHLADFL